MNTTDTEYKTNSFRLADNERHMPAQFQTFCNNFSSRSDIDIRYIVFGKQDSRGALSITVFDQRHCVPMQRHFSSKQEMFGYVEGYNNAMNSASKLI